MSIGLNAGNTRFIVIWLAFSLLSGLVVRKALFETPLRSETPRLACRWFAYRFHVPVLLGGGLYEDGRECEAEERHDRVHG
ncbi:hypothetical protein BC830DRAFT_1129665 [Chytriomyces sp. MP71]|nr:hypothetical protein BC830DRAFT_1129665 [Chytriomyces sp. MP71]